MARDHLTEMRLNRLILKRAAGELMVGAENRAARLDIPGAPGWVLVSASGLLRLALCRAVAGKRRLSYLYA